MLDVFSIKIKATERNTEKKQSLTTALVVKNRQYLRFWVCLATAAYICSWRWIGKETLVLQPSQQQDFVFSTEKDAFLDSLWCQKYFVHFLTQEIWFTALWGNLFSLLPSTWQKGSRAIDFPQVLISKPKIQFTGVWNGSTFRSHSSSNYISHLPVLDAVSGQLLQQMKACRYIPAKEYQVERYTFFSCQQKWGSKCFAQPSVIF